MHRSPTSPPFSFVHALALIAATLGMVLPTRPAQACGGLFCSTATPVNQTAEQILFARNADGTVTAVINILYQGPAERFAWVLPVAGVPEVEVSSSLAFSRLLAQTNPSYSLNTRIEGTCAEWPDTGSGGSFSGGFLGGPQAAGGATSSGTGVSVEASGSVGPYDYVIISVMEDAGATVALRWLTENDYDVSALGEELLADYLEQGLNLLAFRLTKGNSVGSIRPVRITYPADLPAIPIRPTAVAANGNMGVMVFVVSEAQAIPQNYKSLVLNEALINWFNFAVSYNDVINRAADEAGGQGFVTEFAGGTDAFNQTLFSQGEQAAWNAFQVDFLDPNVPVIDAVQRYGSWDGFREAMQVALTLPPEVPLDSWLGSPWLYEGDPRIVLDRAAFVEALRVHVIEPLADTQRLLLSRPYLTRLFTTLSPDEMTLDPIFSENPELADLSNLHVAERVVECSPDLQIQEAPWRVDLGQNGIVRGTGFTWPFDPTTNTAMPANRKIVELSENGSGRVVEDNTEAIWRALEVTHVMPNPALDPAPSRDNPKMPIGGVDPISPTLDPSRGEEFEPDRSPKESSERSGLCALFATPGPLDARLLVILLLSLGVRRLRLRPRPEVA